MDGKKDITEESCLYKKLSSSDEKTPTGQMTLWQEHLGPLKKENNGKSVSRLLVSTNCRLGSKEGMNVKEIWLGVEPLI